MDHAASFRCTRKPFTVLKKWYIFEKLLWYSMKSMTVEFLTYFTASDMYCILNRTFHA